MSLENLSDKEKEIKKALDGVDDPEIHIPITDLGLVYGISEKKGDVLITITLTSIGCPLYTEIETDILNAVKKVDGVKKVGIDLTFDPPWSPEKMTEEARADLGIEL